MNKTKIIAYIALAAILSACGSDDGGGPPELAKNLLGPISPFDTLKVKFTYKLVGLDTSSEANVVLGNGKKWLKSISGKELYFIGANTTDGGSHYFAGGKIDSIEFKNIKNSDDYKNTRTVVYFSTHTILDNEWNGLPEYANDIESSSEKITDGITFTGIIDKDMGVSKEGYPIYDKDDYYKLNLKRNDIISVTVTNTITNKPTPLKVRFFGACHAVNKNDCNDKTDSTTAKNKYSITLMDTIKTGHIKEGDINQVSQFYIDIFENTNDKPNPYIVTVKKL